MTVSVSPLSSFTESVLPLTHFPCSSARHVSLVAVIHSNILDEALKLQLLELQKRTVKKASKYCQAQVQAQIQVPNPVPKPSPKSQIQSPEERDWDWDWD